MFVQLCEAVLDAANIAVAPPPLSGAVGGVIGWSPEKQMRRVHARRVVAMVANMQAGRNGSTVYLDRHSVRIVALAEVSEDAVSSFVASSPFPTSPRLARAEAL
jgi:hypothetical protein